MKILETEKRSCHQRHDSCHPGAKMSGYISVIPKSFAPHAKVQQDLTLYAANGTEIPTYGTKRILLDLGLRRQFTWSSVIADVRQPIIGVDFLKYFNLLVDAKHHRVIDANTKLSSNGQLPKIKSVAFNLAILVGYTKFDKVLKQYCNVTSRKHQHLVGFLCGPDTHTGAGAAQPLFDLPRNLARRPEDEGRDALNLHESGDQRILLSQNSEL
ncbi:gag-pol polyprotein [Trichonephila clavipes]|nr:gag-pol polyprotein [Trichonephila clavipes]